MTPPPPHPCSRRTAPARRWRCSSTWRAHAWGRGCSRRTACPTAARPSCTTPPGRWWTRWRCAALHTALQWQMQLQWQLQLQLQLQSFQQVAGMRQGGAPASGPAGHQRRRHRCLYTECALEGGVQRGAKRLLLAARPCRWSRCSRRRGPRRCRWRCSRRCRWRACWTSLRSRPAARRPSSPTSQSRAWCRCPPGAVPTWELADRARE
jgi:hypothetical protein